jgi:hypothetical protein
VLLTAARAIPALNPNRQGGNLSSGSVLLTIPGNLAAGGYWVLACADDVNVVKEISETNNCAASFATMQVTRGQPDHWVTAVRPPTLTRRRSRAPRANAIFDAAVDAAPTATPVQRSGAPGLEPGPDKEDWP